MLDPPSLLTMARGLVRNAHLWPELADPPERTWDLMAASEDFEAWIVGWPPGGAIEWHDHGGAGGAVVVASGTLVEHAAEGSPADAARLRTTAIGVGEALLFGPRHVHDVVNAGTVPAVSVHVYAPRLKSMTYFDLDGGRLAPTRTVRYRFGQTLP